MTGVLIKRGNLDTDMHTGRTPCDDEGRDWGDASTSQETPRMASKPPEAGREAWNRSSLTASEGTHSANTLISDLSDNKFLLLKPCSL